MKVRKTIKKIAALGVGLTMVGATLMGAAASDLGDFPTAFITDGQFNGLFVIGDGSDSIDTIGQSILAAAVQSVAVKKTVVSAGTSSVSLSEGAELGNDDFYIGDEFYDVEPSGLTDTDLDILEDGTFDDNEGANKQTETYQQQINFYSQSGSDSGTGELRFDADDTNNKLAGLYLYLDRNVEYAYAYNLSFDNAIEYDNTSSTTASDDLEDNVLTIQGNDYTITDVTLDSAKALQKFTLLAGKAVQWVSQGEEVTLEVDGVAHTVKVVDVTESDASTVSCGLDVDGTTVWVDEDETRTVNGITVGVTEVRAVHSEGKDSDVCKVSLGATEILLEDSKEVKIDDSKISDLKDAYAYGTIETTATGTWTSFNVGVRPENEDVWLAPGDEWVDPVLGNFKIVFADLVKKDVETIAFDAGSSSATLKFNVNKDGKEMELDFAGEDGDTDVYWGTDDSDLDELIYFQGETCNGVAAISECEGIHFLVVNGGEAHLVELSRIDTTDNEVDFYDVTYGKEDDGNSYVNGDNVFTISGGAGAVNITIDETAFNVVFNDLSTNTGDQDNPGYFVGTGCANFTLETEQEATIWFLETNCSSRVFEGAFFNEYNDGDMANANDHASAYVVDYEVNATYDDSDDNRIEFDYTTLANATDGYSYLDFDDDNDDDRIAFSYKGTEFDVDAQDYSYVTIKHPHDAAYAVVYFAPVSAESSVSEGGVVKEEVQRIPPSAFKFASEVTNPTAKNLISVGGPCANAVTAELLNSPDDCGEAINAMGVEVGQALIKWVTNGNNVALVIAGRSGADTKVAASVMSNSADYVADLDGKTELVVNTVNENSITFTSPAAE